MAKVTLKRQVESKISRCWKRQVFTRNDFIDLGGYDQIGRALLQLTREGKLIRIGYGLYAKARVNRITGAPMLAAEGGFTLVAREALDLLKVKWEPSVIEQKYNAGTTTQVPVNSGVSIKSRFNRKIATEKFSLEVA